jgi:2-methylcitrate dehydratase PrpD
MSNKFDELGTAEIFSKWCFNLEYEDIPNEVIDKIKLIFMDSLGLIFASRNEDYIKAIKQSFTDSGNCTVPGHLEKLCPSDAIVLNGTAIHGEDFDDTFEGTPVHVGSVMCSSLLTAAEYYKLEPKEILKGLAVGSELMCRLALVSPMAIHKQGFHPTAILGAFGASIGISKILKNSVLQTTSSLGIVGSMASGIIEYLAEGTWTKRLHPGWAGASGWKSAHLGKNNFKGPRTVLDGKNGIFNSFADSKIIPDFKKLTDDLGTYWHTNNLAIKPFACGTMTQPFIDCAIKAREKINDLNEIESIICKVGEGTVHRLWEPLSEKRNPTTPYSAKFSVPFCIAVGLYFGKAGLLEFTEKQIKNRKILNLCSKISYEIDPKNEYPKNYSGEINIILKNSQVIQDTQPGLRGGKLFPLDEKEVEEKFFDNLKFGNLSSREVENVNKFFTAFFNCPDFSLLH